MSYWRNYAAQTYSPAVTSNTEANISFSNKNILFVNIQLSIELLQCFRQVRLQAIIVAPTISISRCYFMAMRVEIVTLGAATVFLFSVPIGSDVAPSPSLPLSMYGRKSFLQSDDIT
jgi:hypothetical protein